MRVFNQTEKLALAMRYNSTKRTDDYRLYYGDNKTAWHGPDTYANCAAVKKRFLGSGQGYKKEFFKIK